MAVKIPSSGKVSDYTVADLREMARKSACLEENYNSKLKGLSEFRQKAGWATEFSDEDWDYLRSILQKRITNKKFSSCTTLERSCDYLILHLQSIFFQAYQPARYLELNDGVDKKTLHAILDSYLAAVETLQNVLIPDSYLQLPALLSSMFGDESLPRARTAMDDIKATLLDRKKNIGKSGKRPKDARESLAHSLANILESYGMRSMTSEGSPYILTLQYLLDLDPTDGGASNADEIAKDVSRDRNKWKKEVPANCAFTILPFGKKR